MSRVPSPWPQTDPTPAHRAAYADAEPRSFWLDSLPERAPHEPLTGPTDADLCIIGGGYTGLWAALAAKADDPTRDVVVLEATRCGNGASGRNGGFLEASLTHGLANGLSRFADEIDQLEALAAENFAGLRGDLNTHAIDCDYETPGVLTVALEPRELEDLRRGGRARPSLRPRRRAAGRRSAPARRSTRRHTSGRCGTGPARRSCTRAVWPMACAPLPTATASASMSSRPVRAIRDDGAPTLTVSTEGGVVTAPKVLMATSAYPPLIPAVGRYIAPVYDYALMTEPLSEAQQQAIGWSRRQGISDMGNQFHYYRPTADGRILYGGYDAVYRYGGDVGPHRDDDDATFATLSQHFFTTFPQLEGLRFSHRWGGAIDTCSRFSVFFGRAHGGRLVYALGYTGLGVGATRFGARVALDLLDGRATPATQLRWSAAGPCRSRPSRCARASSSSRATAWPPPTATTAAAACG